MANRYVWDQYNIVSTVTYSESERDLDAKNYAPSLSTRTGSSTSASYELSWSMYSQCTFDPSQGYALSNRTGGGTITVDEGTEGSIRITVPAGRYIVFDRYASNIRSNITGVRTCYVTVDNTVTAKVYIASGSSNWHINIPGTGSGTINAKTTTSTQTYSQGSTLQGRVSSASSSAYPRNGKTAGSNGKWCVYQGSDCIDPTAVGYSTTTPKPGQAITVNVTPRSNTYGGTISYQYQYSTDGGSTWTNSGSATTATSKSITVPSGATQFRARVVASDNMGFTSTTYVTGENLTMGSIEACVGGVIKRCTPVVGRAGAVKTSVKVYTCVGGVIKQS